MDWRNLFRARRDGAGMVLAAQREQRSTRSQLATEIGAGGVAFYNGTIDSDEFNAKLTGLQGVETYDKMRRTDAQVEALVNAIQLPVLAADWSIERPQDEAEAEKITDEHLDFARSNLFTRINFQAALRHALSCVWAGYAWFEKVYVREDEFLQLRRLAPRLATTVNKWQADENGTLIGIQQRVVKDGGNQDFDIPRDKLALFVYQQEANNPQGLSALRGCYKHWFIKDQLYRLDAIRAERFAVGVPVIHLPAEYTDPMFELAQTLGKRWKGAEQSFAVLVEGMSFEIAQMKGAEALDLIGMIRHHNEEIAKAGLAQFINYGTTQTGSRALGESATEFFYDAEEALAETIARTWEREVIWPLMDLNFADKPRPAMSYKDLGTVSLPEMVSTLSRVGPEYLPPRLDVENAVRERLHLPPRTQEEVDAERRMIEEGKSAGSAPEKGQGASPRQTDEPEDVEKVEASRCPDCGTMHLQAEPSSVAVVDEKDFWRPLRPVERHVALRQIDGMLDDSRDRIMRSLIATRQEWVDDLMEEIATVYPDGPEAIMAAKIEDSLIAAALRRLLPILADVFNAGASAVQSELASQAAEAGIPAPGGAAIGLARETPITVAEAEDIIVARERVLVTRLARKTEEAAWQIAIDSYRTLGPTDLSIDDVVAEIFSAVEAETRLTASVSVSEAMSLGRNSMAQLLEEDIRTAEYSAILDQNTCVHCSDADGFQTQVGTRAYYDVMPPLKSRKFGSCEGLSRCRCMWVYILKIEAPG